MANNIDFSIIRERALRNIREDLLTGTQRTSTPRARGNGRTHGALWPYQG